MNNIGRNKLFMSIGLSVLLMIQILIFLRLRPESRGVIGIMFGIVIILAIVAVAVNWSKVKEIEDRIGNLPVEYKDAYMDANESIAVGPASKTDKTRIMDMVLEIFEHASMEGRAIDEVTGGNLESFMKGFIEETGNRTSFLYMFSYCSVLYIGYLFFMKLYKVVRTGSITLDKLASETLDIGLVATYAIIAYAFFPWLNLTIQKAAREQWKGAKRLIILLPFVLPLGLVSMLILVDNPKFIKIIDIPVPIFSTIPSILVGIALLAASIKLMRYSRRQ